MNTKKVVLVLVSVLVLCSVAHACTDLVEDAVYVASTTLCSNTYYYNDTNYNGIFQTSGNHIHIDCNNSRFVGNWTGDALPKAALWPRTYYRNITFENCYAENYYYGAYVRHTSEIRFINCTFNYTNYGVLVQHNVSNLLVTHNTMDNPQHSAVRISGAEESKNMNITHNNFWGAGNTGLMMLANKYRYNNTVYKHNVLTSPLATVEMVDYFFVENNTVLSKPQATSWTFYATNSTNIRINNNSVNNYRDNFRIDTLCDDVSITNNTFYNQSRYQMLSVRDNTGTVTIKNNLLNYSSKALYVQDNHGNLTFANNRIDRVMTNYDSWNLGVLTVNSSNVNVSYNNFTEIGCSGVVVSGGNNTDIHNNHFSFLGYDDTVTYAKHCDFEPVSAIFLAQIYRTGLCGWSDASVHPKNKSTNHVDVADNTFDGFPLLLRTQGSHNVSQDLTDVWTRTIQWPTLLLGTEKFYVSDDYNNVSGMNSSGHMRTYLKQGFFQQYDVAYVIKNQESYFDNLNNTQLFQLNLVDLVPPYDDVKNESNGQYLSYFGDYNVNVSYNTRIKVAQYGVYIDNCSTYNQVAINFTLRNETDNAKVNGNMAGFFTTDDDVDYNYNLSWDTNSNNYGLCIQNNTETLLDGQLEYSDGYRTRTYYFVNASISNITNQIDLFFVDETSQVLFYVIDEYDDDVVEAYIKVQLYDITTATSKTVEILKTDDNGAAVGNIVLNSQYYTFLVEKDGDVLLETLPTIITASPKTFRVKLGTDYFEDYNTVYNVAGTVSYDNSTKLFSYTFNDPSGLSTTGCLSVTHVTTYGDSLVVENCTSSSAATITASILGEPYTQIYLGTGTVTINGQQYLVDEAEASFVYSYKTFGQEGMFLTWVVVGVLGMIGVASGSVAATIFIVLFGIFISIFSKIFYLAWPAIIALFVMGGVVMFVVSRRKS